MTDRPAPTDSELWVLWDEGITREAPTGWLAVKFARAVLAKWGTPPPAVAREPLTDDQCSLLLAATFCVASVGDPACSIKPEDSERIITLLQELGGFTTKEVEHADKRTD